MRELKQIGQREIMVKCKSRINKKEFDDHVVISTVTNKIFKTQTLYSTT
jgi:hypothetical protein